jgi:eukaryotic-like serine/threonine-protein kinase
VREALSTVTIKPANIFLRKRGHAKILDFGLTNVTFVVSRVAQSAGEMSQPTVMNEQHLTSLAALGTVAYMSPNQAKGKELDSHTDLFSFWGSAVRDGNSHIALSRRHFGADLSKASLDRTPTPPIRLNPDLPAEPERIINQALEKERRVRYQPASEMRADLKRLKRETDTGKTEALTATTPVLQTRLWWRRKTVTICATGLVIALAVLATT